MAIQNLLGTVFISDTRKIVIINRLHQQAVTIASKGGRENFCRCFHLIVCRTVLGSDVICKLCQVLQNALAFVFARCPLSGSSFIRTCLSITFTMRVAVFATLAVFPLSVSEIADPCCAVFLGHKSVPDTALCRSHGA